MSRIYSAQLWAEADVPIGVVTTEVATPPAVVVIRSIDATNLLGITDGCAVGGFEVGDGDGNTIWRIDVDQARQGRSYAWRGRQVLGSDNLLAVSTYARGWSFYVSGYVLQP